MMDTIGRKNLEQALANSLSPSDYQGTVSDYSRAGIQTNFIDSNGAWMDNQWIDHYVQFPLQTLTVALRGVWRRIVSNTATLIVIDLAPAQPVAGDLYTIRSAPSQDGKDATGVAQPTGGKGIRGWLSGSYDLGATGKGRLTVNSPIATGSVNIANNNALTSLSFGLVIDLVTTGGIADVRSVTLAIANVGTGQAIIAASLELYDNVGGLPVSITYPLTGVNIASGAAATSLVALNQGIYRHAVLNVTFGAAPVAGSVTVQANMQGSGAPQMSLSGSNLIIADTTAVWANSALVNTAVNLDMALPSSLQGNATYEIVVTNPSAVTALTVVVKNKETLNAVARYPELIRFGVTANTPDGKAQVVQGWMLGEAGRLTLSNDTVLGAADGFTAYVRVRKV